MSKFEKTENAPFTNEQYSPENVPMRLDDDNKFIVNLTSREETFCSFVPETTEEKAILFKAMNNPDSRLSDCINMTLNIKDVYCEVVTCVSEATGESTKAPRIVLIDTDGKGYQCVSVGIYSALKKLFSVFGTPTWEGGLPITVKQIKKGARSLLTFDVQL